MDIEMGERRFYFGMRGTDRWIGGHVILRLFASHAVTIFKKEREFNRVRGLTMSAKKKNEILRKEAKMTQEQGFSTVDLLKTLIGIAGAAMIAFGYKNPPTFISGPITVIGILIVLLFGRWVVRKYLFFP